MISLRITHSSGGGLSAALAMFLAVGLAVPAAYAERLLAGNQNGEFFYIDAGTGAGTLIGMDGSTASTEVEYGAGRLLSEGANGDVRLYTLDPATGAVAAAVVHEYGALNGLEYVGDTLYGTFIRGGGLPSSLVVVDPESGLLDEVGATAFNQISGLAYDPGGDTLWGVTAGDGPAHLLTLNRASGEAAQGPMLTDAVSHLALTRVGSIEFLDGVLYAGISRNGGPRPGGLYRVDPATGDAAFVGDTGFSSITGLTAVPEGLGDVAKLRCPGDLDGDGIWEVAVVRPDARVEVRSLAGRAVARFAASAVTSVDDVEVLPDSNGNGAPELVLAGRSGDSVQAEVVDALTGRSLYVVGFDSTGPLVDLAAMQDQTANGLAELALLSRQPPEVELRDPAGSVGVNRVPFSGYVRPVDLEIYGDQNGNGAPELGLLGDNRNLIGSDKIELRDSATGAVVREIWLGKFWTVLEQDLLADFNGNGAPEVAVLRLNPGGFVNVQVRDTETEAWLNFVGFDRRYPPKALVAVDDLNGNGADELAVFGRRADGENQKAVIKDSRTGAELKDLWFDRRFPGEDFVGCGDINGNGTTDVALLGRRASDGRLKVMVKDSGTGERLGLLLF